MPTSAPSQAQTAGLAGLSGLFSGIAAGQKHKQEMDKAAYLKSIDPSAQYKQARLKLDQDRFNQFRAMYGGGDGTKPLGELLLLEPDDPRYFVPVPLKQQAGITVAGIKAGAPSVEESKKIAQAGQMAAVGTSLGQQWKEFGLQKGSLGQSLRGAAAGALPGQISQRLMDPKYKVYDDTKKILSETALRIATGAATNPSEIAAYKAMLPEPGDAPAVATNKINNFFTRANEALEGTSVRLESQGFVQQAQKQRKESRGKLEKLRMQMLQDFGGAPSPTQVPTQAPASGGGPRIVGRRPKV